MAETTAVSGGPEPAADSGPWDAVPPQPAHRPAEEHPPGPAALYEPPPAPPAPPVPPVSAPLTSAPPVAPTGWTLTGLPAAGAGPQAPASAPQPAAFPGAPAPAGPGGLGTAPRGRILVIEGGYGNSGRRTWGRGGPAQAPVLSAMLAAVSPQVLLAADAVDAVHLPGAGDPHTVLAHLRAASRHPGPLLVHLGGHVVADKRGGQLQLTLRDAKQDGLPWQAVAAELSHRPAEWQTLVIADLSADQNAWPYLQGTVSPLSEGIPLWAVVSPDPEQIGTFTRALIEALHGGRPGAGEVLAPEQLRQQVYSVLRPDVIILATHVPDRPVFRNTARRGEAPMAEVPLPVADRLPVTDALPVRDTPPVTDAQPVWEERPVAEADVNVLPPLPSRTEPQDAVVERARAAAAPLPVTPVGGPVNLVKPGVPPTPPRPSRPVSLLKAGEQPAEAAANVSLDKPGSADAVPSTAETVPPAGVTLRKAQPEPELEPESELEPAGDASEDAAGTAVVVEAEGAATETATETVAEEVAEVPRDAVPADAAPLEAAVAPREDYREVIGRIVRSADAGDHAAATDLAFALELEAIAEHGAVSEPVLQVRQVRAHVCRLAGRPAEAADIYREVALTLLRSQGADHPETQQAATNAEACWRSIADRAEAVRIAPEIIELRAFLPGRDNRKLRAAERYLAQLVAAAPAVADQA